MAGRHLFVCTRARASGKPACGPAGGDAVIAAVQRELVARGALDVLVTACDCLGPCFDGPNAVMYPEGTWYAGLAPADAPGLADHAMSGRPLASKISQRPGPASAVTDGGSDGGSGDRSGDGSDDHSGED